MVKTKFFKIACLMSAATMLATCINSGTMAKYASTKTISGLTLTVASWNVLVADTPIHDTISLDGVEWQIQSIDDSLPEPNPNRAAPGTWGYAEIPIVNNSDVDAFVKVSGVDSLIPYEANNASPGLTFKTIVSKDEISDFDSAETDAGVSLEDGITLDKSDGAVYIYVYYKWDFESGYDAVDTELAEEPAAEFTFGELEITAEQSDGKAS